MRILILLAVFISSFFTASAQTNSTDASINDSSAFSFCAVMPAFQNPEYKTFENYLAKNIIYPKDAKALGKSGTVYVEFIVEKNGSVSNVKIIPGRGLYWSLDQEAIRVISNSPKWKPGMQNGQTVRVKKIQKINFNLQINK
jgi:TonB family protein